MSLRCRSRTEWVELAWRIAWPFCLWRDTDGEREIDKEERRRVIACKTWWILSIRPFGPVLPRVPDKRHWVVDLRTSLLGP